MHDFSTWHELAPRRAWLLGLAFVLVLTPTAMAASPSPPIFRGASGQFTFLEPVDPAPEIAVRGLDGRAINLAQFRGKVVVLNFWATWCLPCISEMPSLDRLAGVVDPKRLAVLAVSIDRNGAGAVTGFMESYRLTHLTIGLDPDQHFGSLSTDHATAGALPLWGLPISYIIDKEGRVLGYITGPAPWDSPRARSFLDYFVNLD